MLLEFLARLFRLDSNPKLAIAADGKLTYEGAPVLLEFLARLFRLDSDPKMAIPADGKLTYEQVTMPRT